MGLKYGYAFDRDPRGKDPVYTWMNNRVEGLLFTDGTTGSSIGAGAHDFNLDATPGMIMIDGTPKFYPSGLTDYDVSNSGSAPPTGMDVGNAIVYTLVAYKDINGTVGLRLFAGDVAPVASAVPVSDADMAAKFDKKVTAFALVQATFHRSDTAELTITIDNSVRPLHVPEGA